MSTCNIVPSDNAEILGIAQTATEAPQGTDVNWRCLAGYWDTATQTHLRISATVQCQGDGAAIRAPASFECVRVGTQPSTGPHSIAPAPLQRR